MFIKKNLIAFSSYFFITASVILMMKEPTQAITIWPAVGIGIALSLVWGYRIIFGIYLAELCLAVFVQEKFSLEPYSFHLILTNNIDIGIALFRSYFGAFLIRYFIGYPNSLIAHQSILKFFLIVGTCSTLVSAALFNGVSYINSLISNTQFSIDFLNMWSRELLGFLIFAPLTMIFISQPKSIWRPRYSTVGLPVIFIFLFGIFIYNKAYQYNIRHTTDNLKIKHELLTLTIKHHIEDLNDSIHEIIIHSSRFDDIKKQLNSLINNQLLKAVIYTDGQTYDSARMDKSSVENIDLNALKPILKDSYKDGLYYEKDLGEFISIFQFMDKKIIVFPNLVSHVEKWLKQYQLNFTELTLHLNNTNEFIVSLSNPNMSLPDREIIIKSALSLNNNEWNIISRPSINYFKTYQPHLASFISKLGFLFAGLIGIMLLILTGKTTLNKIRVNERTLDLDAKTKDLRDRKKQYQALIEQHPVILWRQNIDDNIMEYISSKVENILQHPLKNWLNEENFWINNIHPEDKEHVQEIINDSINNATPFELEYRFIKVDGTIAWVRDVVNIIQNNDYKTQLVGLMIDVTETQDAKIRQTISEKKYRTLFKHAADPLVIINLDDGTLKDCNEKAIDLFAINPNDQDISLEKFSLDQQPDGSRSNKQLQKIYRKLQNNKYYNFEWVMINDQGDQIICDIVLVKLPEQNNNIALANITDITEKRAHEKKINQLAYYDNLTKLPNREYFYSKFEYFHQLAINKKMYGSIIYLDLDRFKILNDSLGHQAGDELLKMVAQRIRKVSRKNDFCARLAGDEFIILTKKFDKSVESTLESSLVKSELILEALNEPYQLGDYEHYITPSIGISVFPFNNDSIDQIIHQADIAMYASKDKGKNTITIYQPEMIELVSERLKVEKAIREAFDKNEFQLHYQTQINDNNEIFAVEALLRWSRLKTLNINTESLISTIEQIGLTHELGYWVFDQACAQLELWQTNIFPIKSMAINVSAKQFHQKTFIEQIKGIISSYDILPSQIIIELTEAAVFEDMITLIDKLNELKDYGIRISLDDFGTGYSSLAYLKYLPIDQLKIDKMFIKELSSDDASKHIISTIVNLAKAMNIELVAEGIETEHQFKILQQLGCQNFQGYYFSKPKINNEVFSHV